MKFPSLLLSLVLLPLITAPAKADPIAFYLYPDIIATPSNIGFTYLVDDLTGPPTIHAGDTFTFYGIVAGLRTADDYSTTYTSPDTLVVTSLKDQILLRPDWESRTPLLHPCYDPLLLLRQRRYRRSIGRGAGPHPRP